MKKKFLFGICAVVFAVFSANVFATSVFPSAFESTVTGGKNCSIASDIIPAFCAPSGPGSFSAAVKSCAPGGMSMQSIYLGMMAMYGNLQNACTQNARKYGGTVQGCIGQWTCYWYGGKSIDMGGECDGNGQPCASL